MPSACTVVGCRRCYTKPFVTDIDVSTNPILPAETEFIFLSMTCQCKIDYSLCLNNVKIMWLSANSAIFDAPTFPNLDTVICAAANEANLNFIRHHRSILKTVIFRRHYGASNGATDMQTIIPEMAKNSSLQCILYEMRNVGGYLKIFQERSPFPNLPNVRKVVATYDDMYSHPDWKYLYNPKDLLTKIKNVINA